MEPALNPPLACERKEKNKYKNLETPSCDALFLPQERKNTYRN